MTKKTYKIYSARKYILFTAIMILFSISPSIGIEIQEDYSINKNNTIVVNTFNIDNKTNHRYDNMAISWVSEPKRIINPLPFKYIKEKKAKHYINIVKNKKLASGLTLSKELESSFQSFGRERRLWIVFKEKSRSDYTFVAYFIIANRRRYGHIMFLWKIVDDTQNGEHCITALNNNAAFIFQADKETERLILNKKYIPNQTKSLNYKKKGYFPLKLQRISNNIIFVRQTSKSEYINNLRNIAKDDIIKHINIQLKDNTTAKSVSLISGYFNPGLVKSDDNDKDILIVKNAKFFSTLTIGEELESCFPSIDSSRRAWMKMDYYDEKLICYIINTADEHSPSIIFKFILDKDGRVTSNEPIANFIYDGAYSMIQECSILSKLSQKEIDVFWFIDDRLNHMGNYEGDDKLYIKVFNKILIMTGDKFKISKEKAYDIYKTTIKKIYKIKYPPYKDLFS